MQDFNSPFDIFESIFDMGGMGGMGGQSSRNMATEGEDQGYSMVLDFKEAVFGVEKEIEITKLDNCETCNGSFSLGTTFCLGVFFHISQDKKLFEE